MPTTPIARRTLAGRSLAASWKGLAVAGSLGVALLAAPAAATAAPAQTHADAPHCAVDSAELRWGIKERFRSYISGSIANGGWTVSDDMRYETPDFIWDQAQGEFEGSLDSGSIAFTGAVHFTGHDGAMQLDLQNPVIEFDGDDTAYLAMTAGSTDSGDAAAVETASVRIAKMDLASSLSAGGTQLTIDGAVPRLTADGAEAMNGEYGTYVAGEDLDPIYLTATVSGCELGAVDAVAPTEAPADGADGEAMTTQGQAEAQVPWLPIIIGGVALVAIGVTGGMLIAGRKKPGADAADAEEASPEDEHPSA